MTRVLDHMDVMRALEPSANGFAIFRPTTRMWEMSLSRMDSGYKDGRCGPTPAILFSLVENCSLRFLHSPHPCWSCKRDTPGARPRTRALNLYPLQIKIHGPVPIGTTCNRLLKLACLYHTNIRPDIRPRPITETLWHTPGLI